MVYVVVNTHGVRRVGSAGKHLSVNPSNKRQTLGNTERNIKHCFTPSEKSIFQCPMSAIVWENKVKFQAELQVFHFIQIMYI
jgi:hypothetical protein